MGKEGAPGTLKREAGAARVNLVSPSRLEIKTGRTPATNCLGRTTAAPGGNTVGASL